MQAWFPATNEVPFFLPKVTATDADSDDFGKVRYSLYDRFNNYEKSHLLRMDTDSGQVCISQDIDRDGGLANFDVLVKAEDGVRVS